MRFIRSHSDIAVLQRALSGMLFYSTVAWVVSLFVEWNALFAVSSIIVGIYTVYDVFKRNRSLINPVTLFSIVWLILIPITSFQYPAMSEMSQLSWQLTFVFEICFAVGGIVGFSWKASMKIKSHISEEECDPRYIQISRREYRIYMLIILLAVALLLMQLKVTGSFGLFTDAQKSERLFPGFSLLITLPTISLFMITLDIDKRKRKLFWILIVVYGALQLLSGMRWTVSICLIAILPNFELRKLTKKDIRRIALIGIFLMVTFLAIASIRGGTASKEKYFIQTGLYSGTAQELVQTEVFRYVGMSQRLIDEYYVAENAGVNCLGYTLSPIEYLLGMGYENAGDVQHLDIYGYNAQNVITTMYLDAGNLWPILAIVWASVICLSYKKSKKKPEDVLKRYFWSIGAACIVVSFFAYLNFFSYWLSVFPFVIWLLSSKRVVVFRGKR